MIAHKKTELRTLLSSVGIVAALGIIFLSTYIYRQPLGWFAWKNFHLESVATALNKSNPELLFSIGNYYFGGGAYDTEKAERYFREALELDPLLSGPHYQLARIYFVRGDFYLAEAQINKEMELHPELKRPHYVRGLIYGYRGRLPEAAAEFKAFLEWQPKSWAGNNDLAWVYFQQGNYAEARDTAYAGLEAAPDNPWLLNSLGVALLNLHDTTGAREAFRKALERIDSMTEVDWGAAYPGNNPDIYGEGFTKMRASIEENLKLLDTGDTDDPGS